MTRLFLLRPLLITISLTAECNCLSTAYGDDWPQWQGPDRNAISKEKGLLQQWPADGPSIAWKTKGLGGGDSAPAIAAGKIFGMSNRGNQEVVWALSESDGKEVWTTPIGAAVEQRLSQSKEGPGGTPAVDGARLYVIGMGGRVACLNVNDGKIVWQRSLTEDFGGSVPAWSYRESPLVDGDKVICTPGGADATLVALHKLTGETVWKSAMPAAPATPAGSGPELSNRPGRTNAPGGREVGADNTVTGTTDPGLFTSEHWGMRSFSQKLPNGKYLAKLYFAETYERVTEAGQRVFSFTVQGQEFKDFDIWQKAGGLRKAYIESVPVEVTDGEFRIEFTSKVENPAIKAIEIIPQFEDAPESATVRIKAGQSTAFTDSRGQVWKPDQGFEGGQMSAGTFAFGGGAGRFPGGGGPGRFGGGRGGFGRSGAAYSSAIAIDFEGQRQYVQLTSTALIGVAASDGKFLWRYNRAANAMGINCSTPIFQDGLLFAASAYGNGGGAVKLSKEASGGITATEVYFTPTMQNHHGGMIVVDGCLYGANGGNEGGFLTCLDFATGQLLWRDRQAPKGSLALADGRLYLRSEQGPLMLIEPSRTGLVERGRFEQPERTNLPAWAHPVIANGKLYVRDQDVLFCYDVAAK
jgi:alcohol dehydrogenase (cytochrome c)